MNYNKNCNNRCSHTPLFIYKVDDVSGQGIPGAVFELTGTCFMNRGVTDENGSLIFDIASCSHYVLREVGAPAGYIPTDHVFNICSDACGRIFVDGVPMPRLTIRNTPISASFTAVKVNVENGAPLAGAVYTLYQNSAPLASTTSNVAGQVTFGGLSAGTYELAETTPPTGFQTNPERLAVLVAQDGSVTIMGQPANGFILNDVPLMDFIFRKLDGSTGLPLAGATFALAQNGTELKSATSDANGLVRFGILAAGLYTLTETIPPPGFQPNSAVYQVLVDADGSIMINGAPLNGFVVENAPMLISDPPVINSILEGAPVITGMGIPGSAIAVTLPSGTIVAATVNAAGTWMINVPAGIMLAAGDIVSANQTEIGKLVSGNANTIVIRNNEIQPGIDVYVENLSTGLNSAQAGDVLLHDAIITNSGTSASVWQSPYVTFYLNSAVTLQVASIRINNRTVSPDEYNYDSVSNTLTFYLEDIPGGGGVSISYRVTVNASIPNINQVVVDLTLGSLV